MYLWKNAWKNIQRSLGKNILIGIIILIISLSSCLALSIRQAANKTKEQGLDNINVTANISYDRKSMMQGMEPPNESEDSSEEERKATMKKMLSNESLSLSELQKYAKANSVKDFYYTLQASFNGSDTLSPIDSSDENAPQEIEKEKNFNSGDFAISAFSSYDAMNEFKEGIKTIAEGNLFSLNTEGECIISDELALYNSLEVNDTIALVNPDNENEILSLVITGIYSNSDTSSTMTGMGSDPANQIYMSYKTLNTFIKTSKTNSENTEDSTYLSGQLNGTYVFDSVEEYEKFDAQARKLGLDDNYVINSSDITAYEESLQPLMNLANYATTFLWIILIIGGSILLIFNIFRLKERKYEIGVLAAIGMNKRKIALQFMIEMFIVTFISILLGASIGSVASVPVTNTLLSSSSTSTNESQMPPGMSSQDMTQDNAPTINRESHGMIQQGVEYISEVSSATDMIVITQVLGIGLLLTLITGGISVIVILRYEPLKILSNRD